MSKIFEDNFYCKLSIKNIKRIKKDGYTDARYESITRDKEIGNIFAGIEPSTQEDFIVAFSDPVEGDILVEFNEDTNAWQEIKPKVIIFNEEWYLESQDDKKIYIRRENETRISPVSKWILSKDEINQKEIV